MIDRDTQGILDAEHRAQQAITSRLAREVHLLRAVAEEYRTFRMLLTRNGIITGRSPALRAYDAAVAETPAADSPATVSLAASNERRAAAEGHPVSPRIGGAP